MIDGAPPAEYGGKTSLVINVTTRSGMGMTKPVGNITTSYGSFGTATGSVDLGYGGKNWGNFFELDGLNTGRFLDPPEFKVFHAKGNEQNVFDRVDYQLSAADSIHTNFNYSRSWFQNPNSYDQNSVSNVVSGGSGSQPRLRDRRECGSAFQDRYVQHRANVHSHSEHQLRPECWRLCATGRLQLLSEWQPSCRPGTHPE